MPCTRTLNGLRSEYQSGRGALLRNSRLGPAGRQNSFLGFGGKKDESGPCCSSKPKTDMKAPVRVAVTGAAGQIGYSILFRIASGAMLGADQPVILHLVDVP